MSHEDAGSRSVLRPAVDVGTFVADGAGGIDVTVRAGRAGLDKLIEVPRIQKFGLALAGYSEQVRTGRLQVVGSTEIDYAATLGEEARAAAFDAACRVPVTAFLVTKGLEPPPALVEAAEKHGVPVLCSPQTSSLVINRVQRFLEERLAPRVRLHGVLLDVYGFGVLVLGESGIGKSECALELVQRGHRLVSDDVVEIRALRTQLWGSGPERLRHHMELRGIGIINIKDLFGVASVRERKQVEMVLRMVRWQPGRHYERLGLDERTYEILDAAIPYLELPVSAGRNLSILVEVAARNQMLKRKGYHPARALVDRLDREMLNAVRPTDDTDGSST